MKERVAKQATGHVETALPFHTEMDDGGFEQFCTDLLNLHPVIPCQREGRVVGRRVISAERLLSGSAQYGGDIRAEVSEGEVWVFQCKRVKSFGPREVMAAIQKVETGFPHADQYVLVTTCGLTADARRPIDEKPKWIWWDASRLTTITQTLTPAEPAMNLVERHFDRDWVKRLLVWGDQPLLQWREFFGPDLSPDRQRFHHRVPFVPQSDTYDRLKDFALHGAGRALILSAPGGQGKSRLLLELAKDLEQESGPSRVRFLNLNRQGLSEEQADFLARGKVQGDLVLVVDDAHRLDAALDDMARATSNAKSVRLVVVTRSHALEAVKCRLCNHGYAERLEAPLCMPRWTPEAMLALAKEALSAASRHHAPRLAGLSDRCPLLVVLGGALVNEGKLPDTVTDEEDFRERVFKGFIDEFLRLQPESDRKRLNRLIQLLSFISPAPKNDLLVNVVAKVLACLTIDVADDLQVLQASGLLIENREGIRLYPDLFADAVLLDACLDHDGRPSFLHREVLTSLPFDDFPSLLRNLAQADWEARARKGAKHSLFDPVWREFVRRFEQGRWPRHNGSLTKRFQDYKELRDHRQDREKLLGQWASFAIYLPDQTLELAELAIKSADALPSSESQSARVRSDAWASICAALPPMLKPIVMWHPDHAERALDILWSLNVKEPGPGGTGASNAITAIAEAANFDLHRPITATAMVGDWLGLKLRQPDAVERLHRQPWILAALLKPFFGREVESSWSSGNTIHFSAVPVSVTRTRPLRQKALAIAGRFLNSPDVVLAGAVLPIIEEAIRPYYPRFGGEQSAEHHEAWRQDRLEVVRLIEHAIETHRSSLPLLLQLRRILWNRCNADPDPAVKRECERVRSRVPDTFEMRVARVLTSCSHDEISLTSGPNFKSEFEAAEQEWANFGRRVAREMADRFPHARDLCRFIRQQLHELQAANLPVMAGALLGPVAEISSAWSASLLEELLCAEEETLDPFLRSVIQQASVHSTEMYAKALDVLPVKGRPEQLACLISFFGWKHVHGGGLSQRERDAVLKAAERTEERVICTLAMVAGVHFSNEPDWAEQILSRLKPTCERAANEVLRALGRIVEKQGSALDAGMVAQCLANLGELCLTDDATGRRHLQLVARTFPKLVYEHLRGLVDSPKTGNVLALPRFGIDNGLSLGPSNDTDYLRRELDDQWAKALASGTNNEPRLALIRSLFSSDPASALDWIRRLIERCENEAGIELAARLAAPQGTRFVFQHPDIVRRLLARGEELGIDESIRRTLLVSACGGARSFSNGNLDPESRYILDLSDLLANRYRDDARLGSFYRMIANSERTAAERFRQMFHSDESD